MAISEDEALRLVQHIEKTARQVAEQPAMRGVAELINQWRADVEAGRPIERKLSVKQSPGLDVLSDTPRSRSTTSGDFVGREEYNNVEQLDMLVGALGLAFIAPPMMSGRLLDTIARFGGLAGEQEHSDPFVNLAGVETTEASSKATPISREMVAQSREAVEALAKLLSEISHEADLTPRRLIESGSKT